jgi:peroxiredoxin
MPTTAKTPTVGDLMPDIALLRPTGETVGLREVTAGAAALVYFMRSATCPVCNAHIATILRLEQQGELAAARVVIVTPSTADDAASVARKLGTDAAIVLASTEASRAAVGLSSFLAIQHSGSFVLDPSGRVLSARTATVPTASFSRDEVLAALSA